jgi:hypothetical protein
LFKKSIYFLFFAAFFKTHLAIYTNLCYNNGATNRGSYAFGMGVKNK